MDRDASPGGQLNFDAAAVDAAAVDAAVDPTPPQVSDLWLGSARGGEITTDAFGDAASCFDGVENDSVENDAPDGVDCNDPDCQSLPSCCANDAACVGQMQLVISEDFEGCVDAVCGHDFSVFGGPGEPVIDGGSLALQGDTDFDTGLYGSEALNLRDERIEMEIEFRLGACGGCIETAAVALTTQEHLGETSFVRPLVGLRALSTINQVQLLVHDRVEETYPAGDTRIPWSLTVRPDGVIELAHGELRSRAEFVPASAAHLVFYGHSSNPGIDRVGARIEALAVERFVTDRVDAWSHPRSLDLAGGRVSVARLDGIDYLAINDSVVGAPDQVRFYLASNGSVLNWLFSSDWEAEDYTVVEIAGLIYVYAINSDGDLVRGAVDLVSSQIGDPERDLRLTDVGWASMGNPSVIEAKGIRILVAEVDGSLGAAFDAGTGWAVLPSLASLTLGAREPSLVAHNDVYWLHYALRNGTRERIRAMVSDQMIFWRDLGDALTGSGEARSVDRFSVSSPGVISDGDSLRMYLSADDHVVRRIAFAERVSPAGRRR